MRLVIQGKELEFRVQERRITTCSVFHKGKEIAADLAIHAPQDTYDQREGERIAVERVANILFERQQQDRKEALVKVDNVFTEIGALSGNVELPPMDPPASIVSKVMAKLDARRKAKGLTMEGLRKVMDEFHEKFPGLTASGRTPNLPMAGLPFILSPFLNRPIVVDQRPRFAFPFGISTKPSGK